MTGWQVEHDMNSWYIEKKKCSWYKNASIKLLLVPMITWSVLLPNLSWLNASLILWVSTRHIIINIWFTSGRFGRIRFVMFMTPKILLKRLNERVGGLSTIWIDHKSKAVWIDHNLRIFHKFRIFQTIFPGTEKLQWKGE